MTAIPQSCDVLIIGGGPAGSSAATHLAQAGIDVVLLERAVFPRNQVGESLIPHIWKFTDMTGVSEKIEQEGFLAKAGSITVWNDKIHQILFSDFGYTRPGLHVERDIFDDILLKHAESCGAQVFNEVAVKKCDVSDSLWPEIFYTDKRGYSNHEDSIRCQYVIDASGHSSFLANQFKVRQTISTQLNFLSLWGYFDNARFVGVDRKSHATEALATVKPVTFVLSFEDGWVWHIVLRGKTSVGLIVPAERTRGMDRQQREVFFKQTCGRLPHLNKLLEPARFIEGSLQFRPNYSYYSKTTAAKTITVSATPQPLSIPSSPTACKTPYTTPPPQRWRSKNLSKTKNTGCVTVSSVKAVCSSFTASQDPCRWAILAATASTPAW